jgi:putative ABC transport system permease protein
MVSADYFQIYASHLLRGRMMSADDVAQRRLVVVVNQSFVRKFFPNADPLGHKIDFEAYDQLQAERAKAAAKPGSASNPPPSQNFFDIAGVVSDIRGAEPDADHPAPVTYVPSTTVSEGLGGILVRTETRADHMVRDVDQAVWSLEPNARIGTDTGSLQAALQKYFYAGPEFEFVMLSTFAAVGLLLVVIGVYSVMAYNVSLLTREIGIRMALGAQRDNILRTVLRKGMILILLGLAVGLFASWGTTRLIAGYIRGVKPTDPWTFGAVIVLILVIGLLACFFPARRATRVDPLTALRYE